MILDDERNVAQLLAKPARQFIDDPNYFFSKLRVIQVPKFLANGSVLQAIYIFGLIVVIIMPGCLAARPIYRWPSLPTIGDDLDPESLRTAIRRSVSFLQKLPPDRVVGEQPRRLTAQDILDSLLVFEQVMLDHWHCPHCLAREIETRFDVIPSNVDSTLSMFFSPGTTSRSYKAA